MDVKEIVEKYLEENGFDGLFYPGECACRCGDLAPCDHILLECEPGYLDRDTTGEFDFVISSKKPKV